MSTIILLRVGTMLSRPVAAMVSRVSGHPELDFSPIVQSTYRIILFLAVLGALIIDFFAGV